MKKYAIYLTLSIWMCYLVLPIPAQALDDPDAAGPVYSSPVIITEIQTGAGTAGDEFVELYNTSAEPVDISRWQLRYINSGASGDTTLLAAVAGEDTAATLIPPHGYYVLHTAGVVLAQGIAGQAYGAKLSNSDKAVGLFAPNPQECSLEPVDALSWGSSVMGEHMAASNPAGAGDRLVRRFVTQDGFYVDSNNNLHDAVVSQIAKDPLVPSVALTATPGTLNTVTRATAEPDEPIAGAMSPMAHVPVAGCTPPVIEDPDALEPPTDEPPVTVEPDGQSLPPEPDTAKGSTMPARNIGLKSPQVTEALPNPGTPLSDAADEFIELYNSNSVAFDLSGFILETGVTTKKRYTFPQGTMLDARSFKAFFSADTHIALSNTQGQVRLLDPFGRELGKTDLYASAKDNRAWALANGTWQWTTAPSPNAANVIKAPVAKAKSSSAKSSTAKTVSKTSGVKGLSTTAAATNNQTSSDGERTPIHTGVLALVGVFAILYGAYEYRSDLANKIYQLRSNRTARREARPSAKGR